jgi:hypothetical protein
MTRFGDRPHDRPFLELLAAYVDGELDAAGRARVEAWLAEHPEARAELETQQRLSRRNQRLWQASAGPSPSEASWSRLVAHVQQALTAPPGPPAPRRPRLLRILAPLTTAAAAVLAVVFLRPLTPPAPPTPSTPDEVWAVATDDDVEIVGIQGADFDRLVVGRSPLPDQIVLATANDVAFEKVTPDTDGMMPKMPPPGATVPMIVVPMAGR